MFFILSKILFYVLMPAVWIATALFFALFSKNKKRKTIAIRTALGLFLFFTNPFIINFVVNVWEKDPFPLKDLAQHDVAVVLTGVANSRIEPQDRVYFNKGADRVTHTIQLYKEGFIKDIVISGGVGLVIGEGIPEAKTLKRFFLTAGVPEEHIHLDTMSVNTRENALESAKIINSQFKNKKIVLVTSAFHMRRAEGCFKQVGVECTSFPVDYYRDDYKLTPDKLFIPSEMALFKWKIIIHEILGYIVYKIVGYA